MKKYRYFLIVFVLLFTLQSSYLASATTAGNSTVNGKIHIDQIGYRTNDTKQIMISGKGGKFDVVNVNDGKTVFSGKTSTRVDDSSGASGDIVYYGDFSSLKTPGSYYISVPGYGKSYSFKIDDGVYKNIKNATLKGLYYQRCGIELTEKYAGVWTHGACHLFDSIIYTAQNKTLDGKGGWHDAGDYAKYSVAASTTAADLLLSYDFFPTSFGDDTKIPESGNKVPDILDESRYGLQWLLKMQDKTSGGVYHKLSSSGFPDLTTMPDADISDQYFTPISSTATGDFAAVMAMASRIYKPFDSKFSSKCLTASEKAWGWLLKNKNLIGAKNPPDIATGEYGDYTDKDERYWAAAELFRTTGKAEYNNYIKSVYKSSNLSINGFGWQNVGGFGSISYCFTNKSKTDKTVYTYLVKSVLDLANNYLNVSKKDGYHVTLTSSEYTWGSNMNVMNEAMQLIIANKLSPNKQYLQAAQNNLHYLLGRNTLDQTYITGFGSKSVLHPHHRPSIADGIEAPIPGLVSGGPNIGLDDDYAKSHLSGQPPAKCYIDDATSYSTNEIDTYWNSPTVFVSACFSSK